jgi:DNA-binding SARP family transcriptional activator
MSSDIRFGLLGPIVVRRGAVAVPALAGKQRVLLAALLLTANRPVSMDELTEALWGCKPPASARGTLRNYVKELRKALSVIGDARISTAHDGYQIRVESGELDISQFESCADAGKTFAAQGAWDQAAKMLREALSLWRGRPLSGVPSDALALLAVPRLTEMWLQALEARIEADLHLGRHAAVIVELRQLIAEHPLRERLHGQLMLALYRNGQQADALAAYQAARGLLVSELGAEPGPELRQLLQQILTADPGLLETPTNHAVPRQAQLPADISDFTGRAEQVAALCARLTGPGRGRQPGAVLIAAVTGPGGIGKTALAIHAAHKLAAHFPDGHLYLNLRGAGQQPVTAADAQARILHDLGMDAVAAPVEEAERTAAYRSLIAGRKVLLLLDDVRDTAQVRPLLPASAGCAVLVTSRNPLADLQSARLLQLDLMTDDEAAALFAGIAGMTRMGTEPDAARKILAACGGLPLAIRIAAARLASDLTGPSPAATAATILAAEPPPAGAPRQPPAAYLAQAPGGHVVPRELPAPVGHFTGRAAELDELSNLMAGGGRALVICAVGGTAGVGKTALAVQWAHQVAERFPDGQLCVNLRGYDPDRPVAPADALASLLQGLGVPGADIPDEAQDRARLYRSRLAGRRMLVLLDNARDGDQVRPLLPGDPGCVAVVTSRDRLAGLVATDGARRLDLDVLPQPDAVGLLRSLIGLRADEDAGAAAALAGLCARLPLALRIAAELAAARPAVPLAELVAELETDRLEALDAGEDRADVRAVFSWSVRQLPSDVARAFALLGLHPGADLDVYAAAALTGTTVAQARRALGRLHRASLLQAADAIRYSMHDLLRAYAREQAAVCDTDGLCDQALTRLFDSYLAAAAAAMDILYPAEAHHRPRIPPTSAVVPAMPGEADARAWLDAERANLVAVVVHCAAHGWPRHATGLAGTLFRYLMTASHLPEADTIYGHALQAARRSDDPAAEASALNSVGGIAMMKGRYRDAAGHYESALQHYRNGGDKSGEARVLHNLGVGKHLLDNHQSAAGYLREAIAAYEDARDGLGAARALADLAAAETELGCYDHAAEHLQRALPLLREAKDEVREAIALGRIGELNLCRGQLTAAADFFEQALAIGRRIDHQAGVADSLLNLGQVSLRQDNYRQACGHLRQALAVYQGIGQQDGEIRALRSLAEALHQAGQIDEARSELTTALQLAADIGHTHQQASAHRDLAESYHSAGEDDQACHHWQQALDLYTRLGAPEADQVRARLSIQQAEQASQVNG